MPVATELRAVWDAMRPQYQARAGRRDDAGRRRRRHAARRAREDRARCTAASTPERSRASRCSRSAWLLLVGLGRLAARHLRRASRAIGAAIGSPICSRCRPSIVIFAVIVFPFFYNIVLSLSNMSLTHFQDWQVVGLQNYAEVLHRSEALAAVRVRRRRLDGRQRRVSRRRSGVLLAVALNGPIRGKHALPAAADHSLGGAGVHHGAHLARHVRLRIRRGQSDPARSAAVSAARLAARTVAPHRAGQLAGRRVARVSRPASSPTSGSAFRS